jgi:uncharacterized phage-associated protein
MYAKNKEKNKEIIKQIIFTYGSCTITALVKLSYLVDVAYYYKNECKISNFNYIRYFYGPFDKNIYNLVSELTEDRTLTASTVVKDNNDILLYAYPHKSLKTSKLSRSEKIMLNNVVKMLKEYGAAALTKIAYETKPMKALGATLGGNENINQVLDFKNIVYGSDKGK